MPGEKISWDQHIHATGEEITSASEIGLWFYPKGEEPKQRSYLIGFAGLKNGQAGLDWSAEVDVPIGPNNRFEPGDPDRGQPTHFKPNRGFVDRRLCGSRRTARRSRTRSPPSTR